MSLIDPASIPHARDTAPWSDCGDVTGPGFGCVFAASGADGAMVLTFDRAGRRHAITLLRRRQPGAEIVLHGRRFDVVAAPARMV